MMIATSHQEQSALGNSARPLRRLPQVKVAYIMSAFPALTETFILYEVLAMQQLGIAIDLYPLRRLNEDVVHPEVAQLSGQVHHRPFISPAVLRAQLHFILNSPIAYFKVLFEVLKGTFGSANFFFGAAAIFPKAVLFAHEMEKKGVHHVHAHFATHPAVAALIIHRLTGIPFSFTAHGSDLHVERRMLEKKVEAAAFAITISSFNKEIMVEECGEHARGKIHIIHCGVDPEAFSNRPGRNGGGRFQILCVAAFKDVKGHRYLVEACKILQERGMDFVCHLIGEGELRSTVEEQIARERLQNNFVLHGARPRSEIARVLAQSDVLALASVPTPRGKREGIPVVLMEGMASGLPVVASNLSGIPELVEDGRSGFLVPPANPLALADALQRLKDDPHLRHQMGQAGRDKVIRDFNLMTNAAKRARLYANQVFN